jgi:hypothetical protein
MDAADANGDDRVDIADGIFLLNLLFYSGPAIPPPGPPGLPCGPDTDARDGADGLGCELYGSC